MTPKCSIVGFVITRDEESRITRSVQSLQTVCDHVVVIDSESTDQTCQKARDLGADTVVHPFEGFAAQRNWSINYAVATYGPDYLMTIDADEWLTPELLWEISVRRDGGQLDADAYLLRRRICFDGRELRWGGFANTWLPRLFRPGTARYEEREVNEHLILAPHAITERLPGHLVNDDVASWEDYIAKHNRYSTLEAKARVDLAHGIGPATSLRDAVSRPYLRRRWVRQHIWDHLPARPALRFFQLYVLTGGALDGRAGFHRALFEAWQEMCTDLKAEARAAEKSHCPQP